MAQAPAAAEEAVEAPKSKKKLILGIAVVLILAIVGGGAAFMMMGHKPAKEGEHAEEAKEEPSKAPVFVSLETFTVNLQPDPDEQYLQIEMTLQVPTEKDVELIKQHMPEVRNRILLLLSSKKPSEISSPEGKKQLTDEIVAQLSKSFAGRKETQKLSGVFFTAFVIQ